MPAAVPASPGTRTWSVLMVAVMIGVDPHKGSHTAVAIGAGEEPLGELRVRASAVQAERLLAWAAAWPERTWAVEGAAHMSSERPGLSAALAAATVVVAATRPDSACVPARPGRLISGDLPGRRARRARGPCCG